MNGFTRSFKAGADLSSNEGYVAKMDASAQVVLATDGTIGTEDLVGIICQNGGNTSGKPVTVGMCGCQCRAVAGGVLTRGTHRYLTTNASGKLVAAAAGKTVIAEWVGQSQGDAAANDVIDVVVCKFHWTLDTDT